MALILWGGFFLLVLVGIALDLGVFNRIPREISTREAFGWTAFWIAQALGFTVVVYYVYDSQWHGMGIQSDASTTGAEAVSLFLAGYLTEKSLSLDNVVVMALIFTYFRVPLAYQHRVLLWGVLGALVLRLIMIVGGSALIREFSWVTYLFGGFLIFSAARMLLIEDDQMEPEKNLFVRLAERVLPVHDDFDGHHFTVRKDGQLYFTRLAIVLLLVESSDVIFAVDSIPAIFAITTDPFLVVTSNVFAILGLRSLYFAIAPLMERFRYLKASLVLLLGFVGVKILVAHHTDISPLTTLSAIIGIVATGALASWLIPYLETRGIAWPARSTPRRQMLSLSARGARKVATVVTSSSALLVSLLAVTAPGGSLALVFSGLGLLVLSSFWSRRLIRKCTLNATGPDVR